MSEDFFTDVPEPIEFKDVVSDPVSGGQGAAENEVNPAIWSSS